MIDQNSQFLAILTNVGVAKQANADALGIPWKITQMGVGDANGTEPQPSAAQTALINERRRAPLNQLKVDPVNAGIIIAEQVIPEDVGGWWIREIGLYDTDNDLVAVANCAPSFKPLLAQGSGRTQVVRMNMIVSSSSNVELKIDPSVVLATRAYVDAKVLEEVSKLDSKQSVRAATTANIALTGLPALDGIALVAGDRVLVKNQTAAKDNGLYVAAAGAWARAADADGSPEVTSALLVSVEQGATQADTSWQLVTDGAIVLGTTALTFQNSTQVFIQNALAALGLGASTGTLVTDLDALSAGGLYYTGTGATGNPASPAVGYTVIHAQGGATDGFQLATTRSVVAANKRMMFWRQRFGGVWGPWESSAQLDSPTFTGTPLAPTAADSSNSTQIATTAHVLARLVTAGLYTQSSGSPSGNDADTVGAAQVEARSTISTTANAPMTQWTKILALPVDASNGVQLSLGVQGDRAFYRRKSAGVFQPWLEFAFLGSPTFTGIPAGPTAAPGTNSTQLATTAFVAALGALKANLASPTFTGTPAGPTAAPGANSTQLATTAFVATAIANLIASSPGALDTLNELAVALGNDPNFATTMTNLLATKAPLASPVLTGAPTAPTPARFDATTKLATMAAIDAVGAQYNDIVFINGAGLTGVLAHVGGAVHFSGASGNSYTLPNSVTLSLPIGATVRIHNWGGSAMSVGAQGTDKMQEATGIVASATARSIPSDSYVDCIFIGSGTWLMFGTGVMSKTGLFSASIGASGSMRHPSGVIIQWGWTAAATSGDVVTALPAAFPNAFFAVTITQGYTAGSGSIGYASAGATSLGAFTWKGSAVGNASMFIAIGN
jgi:phage-related tail fiber protein